MFDSLLPKSTLQAFLYGLVILLGIYLYFKRKKNTLPPGPFRLPLLGNVLQLGADKRYHIKFYEWSKKYGPVITVGLGPVTIVVVNTLETATEVLVKKSTDFSGRQESPSTCPYFFPSKYSCMGTTFTSNETITIPITTIRFEPGSGKTSLIAFENNMVPDQPARYMQGQALEERIHTALQTVFPVLETMQGPFDPYDVINFLIINIVMGLCFNGEYEYGNAEIKSFIEQDDEITAVFNDFIPEDLFPPLEYVFTSKNMKKMQEFSDSIIRNFIGGKFHEQKRTFDKDNIRHLTDMLLLAKEETEAEEGESLEGLSDEHLLQTIANMFFAGIDTSRHTLQFAILHMIAFPDIQKKVQEEIDREIGKGRLPGIDDRPNLGYTEAVLHESMRLATVLPSGLLHRTLVDTEIDGYKIPKKTLVMINHWALHNDPNAWDEVGRFIPERYLDENGRLGPKPPNWLPFSAGRRVCMGEFVAKPELHLLFAGLMQRFSWRAETGVNVKIEPEGNLFLGKPPPFKVVLKRRI